jgi:hypothetical protein
MNRNIKANGFGAICYDGCVGTTRRTRSPWRVVAPSCRLRSLLIALNYYNCGGTRFVSHRKVPPESVLVIAHLIIPSIAAAQIRYRIRRRS